MHRPRLDIPRNRSVCSLINWQALRTAHPGGTLKEYQDVFTGLGCLPGEYHIEVDPAIKPLQLAPRRVPLKSRYFSQQNGSVI